MQRYDDLTADIEAHTYSAGVTRSSPTGKSPRIAWGPADTDDADDATAQLRAALEPREA